MKFYIIDISSAFLNTREIIEIARAADELGYDGIGIPDHGVNVQKMRAENGFSIRDCTVLTPLTEAFTTADYRRAADLGLTGVITMPWTFYAEPDASLPQGTRARR